MTEPVLGAAGVYKSFRQGPETLEVLRGISLADAQLESPEAEFHRIAQRG